MSTIRETRSLAVRPLTPEELPLCVPLGEAMHAEMRLPGSFQGEVFVERWRYFLAHFPSVILALWSEDALAGGFGALVAPDQYDQRLVANELFWYVHPPYRRRHGAQALFEAFERWALAQGAEEARVVHLLTARDDQADAMNDRVARFYQRRGYRPLEMAWRKTLKGG